MGNASWYNYSKLLKSNFADIANIGGRMAGSVTQMFLRALC